MLVIVFPQAPFCAQNYCRDLLKESIIICCVVLSATTPSTLLEQYCQIEDYLN